MNPALLVGLSIWSIANFAQGGITNKEERSVSLSWGGSSKRLCACCEINSLFAVLNLF